MMELVGGKFADYGTKGLKKDFVNDVGNCQTT